MAGLNISATYFFAVVALSQVVRMVSRRLFLPWVYCTFLLELVSCFQLGACWLELRMLTVIGPWGGGFGRDVVLTLFFILVLIHEYTLDGAHANPLVTLQELLCSNAPLAAAALRILSQFGGVQLASAVTKVYWSWELTEFHLIQNLMAIDCSSTIQTSISHGALVEAACVLLLHLVVMKFEGAASGLRILSKALTITALVYIATTLAVLLFNGHIPLLFSKNLLYSKRTKYKIPKGKSLLVPEENKAAPSQQTRKRDHWKKGSEMVAETENDK
ncbi:aquaporin 12 isoform X3 [Hemitrygon akajei]|uniref:aquaporin 12 isoform X3 n=1 Tax=Hemitrygon akajei TaxID=2704970 RepID=UPI003BF9871C